MRLSFIGEMGWELHAPNHAALEIYRALFRVGKELGLRNSGYRAMDSLSVEKGQLCQLIEPRQISNCICVVINCDGCSAVQATACGIQTFEVMTHLSRLTWPSLAN